MPYDDAASSRVSAYDREGPTPREPAEIMPDGRVVNWAGEDVTEAFERGARAAVEAAAGCACAILKSRSPSCGPFEVYDGTFSGTLVPGSGLVAKALMQAGVVVVDEETLERRRGADGEPTCFPMPLT